MPPAPSAARLSREWDELADADALWAILSDDAEQRGRWRLEEFFATGEREVANVLGAADDLGRPQGGRSALDFGCGVGRLTRALAARFETAVGVDVSPEMVRRAAEVNGDVPGMRFLANVADDLALFDDDSFDLVYSSKVLQHMSSPRLARAYIAEFLRVARPDGLVAFQLWTHVPWRKRLQPRRRLYGALRAVGVPTNALAKRGLSPRGRGIGVPEDDVRRTVEQAGWRVERTRPDGEWGLWYYAVAVTAY